MMNPKYNLQQLDKAPKRFSILGQASNNNIKTHCTKQRLRNHTNFVEFKKLLIGLTENQRYPCISKARNRPISNKRPETKPSSRILSSNDDWIISNSEPSLNSPLKRLSEQINK